MTDTPARRSGLLILIITLVALALRVAAVLPDSLHHPDEIGQYIEQAHRIVFGYGTITWEYRLGMRNWLLPLFFTLPMSLGHWLSPASELYLLLPRLTAALASLAILWAAYRIGKAQSQRHAMIALVVAAFWFEFVMFAAHTLSEPLATAAILAAVALLYDQSAGKKVLALAGFLLGIGILLRFQYGLPSAIIALGLSSGSWKARFAPVVVGGLIAVAFGALLDLAMGMMPYSWILTNIYQNVVLNRSASYGVSPVGEYLTALGVYWGVAAAVILPLVLIGYKQHRVLIWAAIANLALHSAIGHKEYRFIFLSTAIFVIVAALASVDVLKWLSARRSISVTPARMATLGAIWIGLSVAQAQSPAMKPRHWGSGQDVLAARRAFETAPRRAVLHSSHSGSTRDRSGCDGRERTGL
jgi:GPI mannosyltransferase 3